MNGRSVRHSQNLFSPGDPSNDSASRSPPRERQKVQLRPQAVAREARPGKARNEKDGLHAGGRARCQRDGARSARPAARAHIASEAKQIGERHGGDLGRIADVPAKRGEREPLEDQGGFSFE